METYQSLSHTSVDHQAFAWRESTGSRHGSGARVCWLTARVIRLVNVKTCRAPSTKRVCMRRTSSVSASPPDQSSASRASISSES